MVLLTAAVNHGSIHQPRRACRAASHILNGRPHSLRVRALRVSPVPDAAGAAHPLMLPDTFGAMHSWVSSSLLKIPAIAGVSTVESPMWLSLSGVPLPPQQEVQPIS